MPVIRPLTLLTVLAMLATACVWPPPLPGEPVPAIEVAIDVSAADQTMTVTVVPSGITPTWVQVWPDGLVNGGAERDESAPWQIVFDTTTMAPGPQGVLVVASDATTYVARSQTVPVTGCNGHVALCDRPYDEVRQVTAHNAMSNATDGWSGPNQNLDVPAQLAAGVRGLMLDTYRAGDDRGDGQPQVPGVPADTAYLCHSLCVLGSQPLIEGLEEIAAFLDDNPGEVVTLILESYLSHSSTAAAFAAAGLIDDAHVQPAGTPWPTLGALVDADTRLIVLQDRPLDPAHPWLMNVWDHAFETHFSNSVPEDFSCAPNRGSPSNDLFILNHFLTAIFGSPDLADQVNHDPLLSDRIVECEDLHSTVANFVTVDFVDIGDTLIAVDAANGV